MKMYKRIKRVHSLLRSNKFSDLVVRRILCKVLISPKYIISKRKMGGSYLGYPLTQPHSIAVTALRNYVKYNTNHIGIFTNKDSLNLSRNLEKDYIKAIGELLGADQIDGYVSSGGTESNLFG